jgi:hypothetical protein
VSHTDGQTDRRQTRRQVGHAVFSSLSLRKRELIMFLYCIKCVHGQSLEFDSLVFLFAIVAKVENNRKQGRNVLTTSRERRAVIGDHLTPPFLSSRKPSLVGMTTILVTHNTQSPTQNFVPRHYPLDWHTKHKHFQQIVYIYFAYDKHRLPSSVYRNLAR